MSQETKIEWADATFNPWIGCRKVSPGCENCYMFARQHRFGKKGTDRIRTSKATWRNPVKWNAGEYPCHTGPIRVFPSLCDWLDPEVPVEWLADFLRLVCDTTNLRWLLLTKRPERFEERLRTAAHCLRDTPRRDGATAFWCEQWWRRKIPPFNVWVGTSVEDQVRVDERIPALLKIPAALRFLSVEPLLGPVDLRRGFKNGPQAFPLGMGIQWVIAGGESGPRARNCEVDWLVSLRDQCHLADVPFFLKQLGANSHWNEDSMRAVGGVMHPKGGDPEEWPVELRVREQAREPQ